MPNPVYLKKNDLQPYYYVSVVDGTGAAVNIDGATISCTMKDARTGVVKINRQTTGITITNGAGGLFEYHWQSGDTDTPATYNIEFEINPAVGGKFTLPDDTTIAQVIISATLA